MRKNLIVDFMATSLFHFHIFYFSYFYMYTYTRMKGREGGLEGQA
jgi:hypothetical protein